MPNAIESQIKDRITAFVAELDQLVRKSTLAALQGVLANGGAAPARRGPGRPAGARPAPRRGRAPADLGDATAKILAHVQANDGQGISAIADATGIDLKTAKKAAGQLLAAGQLKKSGAKRGTVYHAGSGRAPRAAKAKRTAKPKRKVAARKKPGARRLKRGVVTPARRRSAPAKSKPVAPRLAVLTDVPAALAVAQ